MCNLAPVTLWDRRAWAIAPKDVLHLVAHAGTGRVAEQQFAGDPRQFRIHDGVEAGRHAFALGALKARSGQPEFFAKSGQHGVCPHILEADHQRLQHVAKLRIVHEKGTNLSS